METRQWLNRSQPQTLVNATLLIYIHAFFSALAGLFGITLLIALGLAASGWGIANERKWAYWLAIGITGYELFFFYLAPLLGGANLFAAGPLGVIGMLFIGARLALLLHPMSREYTRIWFK
jgi:hypothetical protein